MYFQYIYYTKHKEYMENNISLNSYGVNFGYLLNCMLHVKHFRF